MNRDRSRLTVEAIKKSIRERGFPPTIRELQEATGARSTATVHYVLRQLEDRGVIRKDPRLSRGIELADTPRSRQVPHVGRVQAGLPVLAEENLIEELPLPQSWLDEGAFALTVRGDSMVEAGILDGDVVFVAPEADIRDGDVAVALIEDEATVKVFYKDGPRVRLEPRNPAFQPILVAANAVRILGKVSGLYRRVGA